MWQSKRLQFPQNWQCVKARFKVPPAAAMVGLQHCAKQPVPLFHKIYDGEVVHITEMSRY